MAEVVGKSPSVSSLSMHLWPTYSPPASRAIPLDRTSTMPLHHEPIPISRYSTSLWIWVNIKGSEAYRESSG